MARPRPPDGAHRQGGTGRHRGHLSPAARPAEHRPLTAGSGRPPAALPPNRPRALPLGGRIAVVAPASSARHERIDQGLSALRGLGYTVVEALHARARTAPYF